MHPGRRPHRFFLRDPRALLAPPSPGEENGARSAACATPSAPHAQAPRRGSPAGTPLSQNIVFELAAESGMRCSTLQVLDNLALVIETKDSIPSQSPSAGSDLGDILAGINDRPDRTLPLRAPRHIVSPSSPPPRLRSRIVSLCAQLCERGRPSAIICIALVAFAAFLSL